MRIEFVKFSTLFRKNFKNSFVSTAQEINNLFLFTSIDFVDLIQIYLLLMHLIIAHLARFSVYFRVDQRLL